MLARGVEPVRQQGEPDIALAVRQVVNLQAADPGLGVGLAGEEHRHDDERSQPRRHAIVQVEPGQRFGPSTWVTSQLTRAIARSEAGRSARIAMRTAAPGAGAIPGQQQRHGEDGRRDQRQRPEVATPGGPDIGAPKPAGQRRPNVEDSLELDRPSEIR
jgi:hypothetical protein